MDPAGCYYSAVYVCWKRTPSFTHTLLVVSGGKHSLLIIPFSFLHFLLVKMFLHSRLCSQRSVPVRPAVRVISTVVHIIMTVRLVVPRHFYLVSDHGAFCLRRLSSPRWGLQRLIAFFGQRNAINADAQSLSAIFAMCSKGTDTKVANVGNSIAAVVNVLDVLVDRVAVAFKTSQIDPCSPPVSPTKKLVVCRERLSDVTFGLHGSEKLFTAAFNKILYYRTSTIAIYFRPARTDVCALGIAAFCGNRNDGNRRYTQIDLHVIFIVITPYIF